MKVKPNECIFIGIQRKNAEFWRQNSFFVYQNAFIRFHFHSFPDKTVKWQWIKMSYPFKGKYNGAG